MERLRALILTAAGVFTLALGSGCITVQVDGDGKLKSIAPSATPGAGPATPTPPPAGDQAKAAKVDPQVKPAGATFPLPTMPKLGLKPDAAKATAVELVTLWQNRVAYLPDPTQNGKPVAGLVGQMFLFGPNAQFTPAEGKVTIELFDESMKGVPGAPEAVKLGQWVFDRENLKRLVTADERFGKSYVLFLPWPTYKSEVTRVKLSTRYDPENGYPSWTHQSVTIDTSVPGATSSSGLSQGGVPPTVTPGLTPGGFPMAAGPSSASSVGGFGAPIPIGGPAGYPAGMPAGLPAGLSPIVITTPPR